jgi:Skp family chaperone for outer membrane proteins
MKKVLFSLLAFAGLFLAGNSLQAQNMKVGVFDLDQMVQAMPGYRSVDSLLQIYQSDSLSAEYNFYLSEHNRLDSTYKADSAAKKAQTVLDMEKQQRQQVAINLVYWQQIAQNKLENKRSILAQPLYEQVANAYKKILDSKKYTLILKPEAVEMGTAPSSAQGGVDNIFEMVAKELKIPLGDQSQQQQQGTPPPAANAPAGSGAAKPAPATGGGAAKPKG